MKRLVLTLLIGVILISVVTATGAVYNMSFQLISGNIGVESTQPPQRIANVYVRDSLFMKQSTIYGNVAVENGPVTFDTGNVEVTGVLRVNPNVYVNKDKNVLGGIIRDTVVFDEVSYDFSKVPQNLPYKGDSTSSIDSIISSSVRYNNFSVNAPLTIDTQNGDVFIVARYLNIASSIVVTGQGKVTIIAESTFNYNASMINPDKPVDRLDLVVQSSGVILQNNRTLRANFYLEGNNNSISILNQFTLEGNLYASKSSVNIREAAVLGNVSCRKLDMEKAEIKAP